MVDDREEGPETKESDDDAIIVTVKEDVRHISNADKTARRFIKRYILNISMKSTHAHTQRH